MARIQADRVAELSTTTGTGAFTLAGALTGFRAFATVCATNDTVSYVIEAVDGSGAPLGDWETGVGTYSGANTLTRTTVVASSNAGAAVNFAAGTKRVFLGLRVTDSVPSGTAFPSAPATDDRFYRTDRHIEYFYDGTRWLSTQIFTVGFAQGTGGISVDTNLVFNIPYLPTYDCYLIEWDTSYTRTAAGEWDFILSSLDSAGALTTIDTQDGSADASSIWINRSRSLTTLLTSSVKALRVAADEVSGTALIVHSASVQYRLVG